MAKSGATTLYVIAYDIPSDKRRTKLHKMLSGYGQWTQFSLFECYLTEKEYLRLRQRIDQHLNSQQDSVRFYPLCAACEGKVETVGGARPTEPILYIV